MRIRRHHTSHARSSPKRRQATNTTHTRTLLARLQGNRPRASLPHILRKQAIRLPKPRRRKTPMERPTNSPQHNQRQKRRPTNRQTMGLAPPTTQIKHTQKKATSTPITNFSHAPELSTTENRNNNQQKTSPPMKTRQRAPTKRYITGRKRHKIYIFFLNYPLV